MEDSDVMPIKLQGRGNSPLNSVLRLSVTGKAGKVQLPETFSDSAKRLSPECGVNTSGNNMSGLSQRNKGDEAQHDRFRLE